MPDTRFFPAPEPEANPYWKLFQENPKEHALAMQCWFVRERLRVCEPAWDANRGLRTRCTE